MKRALLALALFACGGSKAPPPTTTTPAATPDAHVSTYAELEARIPKMLSAFDALAKDLTAADSDCPKIAAVLRKWGSTYAVELDALWELKNQLTPSERERYEHEHDEDAKRLDPVFKTSLAACQGNTEVEDALTVAGFRRAESAR